MIMAKDPITNKKSVTITLLALSFLVVLVAVGCRLYGAIDDNGPIYAALAFHLPYIAVYWNKRFTAGKEGVTFDDADKSS